MSKAFVVYMAGGVRRKVYPADVNLLYDDGVLTIREKFQQPEWWVSYNIRFLERWGIEEVDQ